MRDKTRRYAKMFSKAMKKLGRTDCKKLENVFYKHYQSYVNSAEYKTFSRKYPSM